uniref:LIM zinc-binding domain-containing protein n=1 Tax=Anopheles melas TaxID=34690 RepID=A0A182TSS9_9DIPT
MHSSAEATPTLRKAAGRLGSPSVFEKAFSRGPGIHVAPVKRKRTSLARMRPRPSASGDTNSSSSESLSVAVTLASKQTGWLYRCAANRPNLLEPAGGVGGGQPVPVRNRFVNTCNTVATVTLHTAEHGVPGARTPLGVVPVNSIHQPPISHMGVCAEERPIMHWHPSARFLGPPRERSPDLSNACQLNSNNNNLNHRTCISCTDTCEHSLKVAGGNGLLGVNHHLYADSCHSFESPDRLIADRPNYYADLNRSDCSDSSSVLNSCIQLKSEPPGGPSSPESSNELPSTGLDECAGCDMPIQDRFYLSAVERKWHASCLQCCICRQTLEGANSCFSRDGNIYCKTDYYR